MAHSSEARWGDASTKIATAAYSVLQAISNAEETYQELFEIYQYAGGTDQSAADLLFQDENGNPNPITGTATAEQVAKVVDLREAIVALHELYLAVTNVVIPQDDRAAKLRRMS